MEFAEINGAGMRYELSGVGGPTIVLVHEMGGSLESWDGAAPLFAKSRQVLRYDFRGSGLSQKARGELSIDTHVPGARLDPPRGVSQRVAQPGVPQEDALGVPDDEARIGHRTGLAVVVTGVGEKPHVGEIGVAAVQGIQPNLLDGLEGTCPRRQRSKRKRQAHARNLEQRPDRHALSLASAGKRVKNARSPARSVSHTLRAAASPVAPLRGAPVKTWWAPKRPRRRSPA